jgi:hypothetical protein
VPKQQSFYTIMVVHQLARLLLIISIVLYHVNAIGAIYATVRDRSPGTARKLSMRKKKSDSY